MRTTTEKESQRGSDKLAEKGWIKLHRKLLDCWIWQEKPFDKGRAWVDLLLLAMHHDKKLLIDNEILVVSRGSFMTSTVKLADRWGWSRNKVLRFLNVLESEQMLNTKRTPKGTLVTIVKYEDFQCLDIEDETTDGTPNETSDETPDETQNKNVKNIKNNIYVQNDAEKDQIRADFEIIYSSYPKKVGKAKGFDYYKGWLVGRVISGDKIKLTNKQMWSAIAKYKKEQETKETELCYYKNFDTFMNKAILDYVGDEE